MKRGFLVWAGFFLIAGYSAVAGTTAGATVNSPLAAQNESFAKVKVLMSEGELDIKWDEVASSKAVKDQGGSDRFHFYLVYWLNALNVDLKEKEKKFEYKETFKHLCYDAGCQDGLDMGKVNSGEDVHLVLKYATLRPGLVLKIPIPGNSMVFFQGYMSPPQSSLRDHRASYERAIETQTGFPGRQMVWDIMDFVEKTDAQEIAVNLPHQFGPGFTGHYNVNAFMELGLFMKRNELDLRVVGRCGTHCANYLVPAADRVIIEPYGYIYTEGSVHGLFVDGNRMALAQRDDYLRRLREGWLPKLREAVAVGSKSVSPSPGPVSEAESSSRLVDFVRSQMHIMFGLLGVPGGPSHISEFQRKQMADNFMQALTGWSQAVWENGKWEEFVDYMVRYQQGTINKSFREWKTDDIDGFVRSLANGDQWYFLEELALFIRTHIDLEVREWRVYLADLQWLQGHTIPYHREVTGALASRLSYDYKKLLDVIPSFVRDLGYEKRFSVLKARYPVPESEKSYVAVLSTELLEKLGVRVVGKIRREVVAMNMGHNVLYLGEREIQNCELLNRDISHDKKSFKECLSLQ